MVEITEQLIEDYCGNKLSDEQLSEFEAALKGDKDLQVAVREMMLTLGALKEIRDENLKKRMTILDEVPKVRTLRSNYVYLQWAAAIILMVVAGYFITIQLSRPDLQEIYAYHIEPYPNVIDPTTRDVGTQSVDALIFYENGEYETALDAFDSYLHLNPEDVEMRFYQGLSALFSENYQLAEEALEMVAKSNNRLSDQATWYLALLSLKMENPDVAKGHLKKLLEEGNSYSQRANTLMKKL